MDQLRGRNGRSIIGAVAIVLGLQLVLAANAGAVQPDQDGDHKVTICHRTNSVTNPYVRITVDYSAADGATGKGNNDHTHHLGPVFDFAADPAVAYPTPRNGDQWGDIIPPYTYDNGSFAGLNWTEAGQAVWDAECGQPDSEDPEDPITTLTVDKIVTGDAAPATWSFPFTGLAGGFELTDTVTSTDPQIIDADTPYVITETNAGGATTTTVSCDGADAVVDGASVTVEVAEGTDATCTFENTFVPVVAETGSITIVKEVVGDDAPDTWSFGFDGGSLGAFTLTETADTKTFDDLAAGEYVVSENDHDVAGLTDIDCGDADVTDVIQPQGAGGSVTIELLAGADVECTFTNTYPEVLGEIVTRTPTITPVAPKTPDVVTQVQAPTLPATGTASTTTAMVGLALLLLGGWMVLAGNRLAGRTESNAGGTVL